MITKNDLYEKPELAELSSLFGELRGIPLPYGSVHRIKLIIQIRIVENQPPQAKYHWSRAKMRDELVSSLQAKLAKNSGSLMPFLEPVKGSLNGTVIEAVILDSLEHWNPDIFSEMAKIMTAMEKDVTEDDWSPSLQAEAMDRRVCAEAFIQVLDRVKRLPRVEEWRVETAKLFKEKTGREFEPKQWSDLKKQFFIDRLEPHSKQIESKEKPHIESEVASSEQFMKEEKSA